MKGFEEIGLEAFKAAEEEREKNVSELKKKVEGVTTTRKEAKEADISAKEALDEYKATRAQTAELEASFGRLLENETIKQHLASRGVETLEDYAKAEGLAENETVNTYKALKVSLKELGAKLRTEVGSRAEAKGHLKDELVKNNPEQKYGTFKKLDKSAEKQEASISKRELETLADGLVEEHRIDAQDSISKFWPKEGEVKDYKPFITTKDVVELQKYGRHGNFDTASWFFREKMKTLVLTLLEERIAGLDRETYKDILEMHRRGKIKENVLQMLGHQWERAVSSVSRSDQQFTSMIVNENNLERLEAIKPELEAIFSELEDKINQNPFRDLVKGFKSYGNQGVYVEFVVAGDPNSLNAKYFNYPKNSMTGIPQAADFTQSGLEDTLKTVDYDLHEAEEEKRKGRESKDRFAARSWLSRTFNKQDGLNISRRLARSESDMYNLGKIKELQEGLLAFIVKIRNLSEREGLIKTELGFGQGGALQLSDFKERYLAVVKKRFGQER